MAGEDEGVAGGGSPSPDDVAAAEAAAAQAAQGDDEDKVPLKNRFAEYERKTQRAIQDAIAPIAQTLQMLAAQQQQQQQRPVAQAGSGQKSLAEYTDEELATLAGQGYSVAFQEIASRAANRQQQQSQQQAQAMAVREAEQELASLRAAYPMIADTSSPLYQKANAIYARKAAVMGQNVFTQLDAIKSAILEIRPEAVVQERSRSSAADLAGALGGVSHARPTQKPATERRTSATEQALANRMGVKDPSGAMKRFKERMDKGEVAVGPVISSALGDVL